MKPTDRFLALAAGFILLYGAVLVWNGPREPETFPFFSWSLFSRTPDAVDTDYGVRFTSIDGEELDTPVYFEQAGDRISSSGSPRAYLAIQQLGQGIELNQILRLANGRDLLEETHMASVTTAEYEVVRRRFDVLDSYECHCYQEETVLAELRKGP